jgi:lipoate-protein ligase A
MSILAALDVYHDGDPRSAALNMAIDEALLETTEIPSIRFYHWASPALSFGYFGKFTDVERHATERDLVRRWTGGGIVFHGDDLTYSIVIPASDLAFTESSMSIYESVHRALADVMIATGEETVAMCARRDALPRVRDMRKHVPPISDSQHCFANPVRADVMINGRKIAGAAQRRTRRGLLQQGSIQNVDVANGLADRFARELCDNCSGRKIDDRLLNRAQEIAGEKYATEAWLRKR